MDINETFVEMAERTDNLNKRLITAIIIIVCAWAISLITIFGFYFLADYTEYPEMSQIQNEDLIEQKIK